MAFLRRMQQLCASLLCVAVCGHLLRHSVRRTVLLRADRMPTQRHALDGLHDDHDLEPVVWFFGACISRQS
eukprot:10211803-Heterocapsa_arctica.AAC.1